MRMRSLVAVLLVLAASSCGASPSRSSDVTAEGERAEPTDAGESVAAGERAVLAEGAATFADLDGALHRPLEPAAGRAHVLLFVTTDCPIANAFAPEIRAIAAEHAGDPLSFFLVHVDADTTPEVARVHAADFSYALPILLDGEQALVRATGATVTPEAVVVGPSGAIAYRGRIDDRFADLGVKRRAPTRRDLREALDAVLAGRAPAVARTEAIGCLIPDVP